MSLRYTALLALSLSVILAPLASAECASQDAVAESVGVESEELPGGCGGDAGDLEEAEAGEGQEEPGDMNAPDEEQGQPPMPTPVSEDVAVEIRRLETEFNVPLGGEWTPQSVQLLENVLSFYRPAPQLLRAIESITLIEQGNVGETGGTGAFWAPNPQTQTARIVIYGFEDMYGAEKTREDVIQHEIGHHVTLTSVGGSEWRTRMYAAMQAGPDVSRYGTDERPDEKAADWWGKMLSTPGFNTRRPFVPALRSFQATPNSVSIANEQMPTQLNTEFQ